MTGTTAAPTTSLIAGSGGDDSSHGSHVGELASTAKDQVVNATSKVRSQAMDMADKRKGAIVDPARTIVDQTKKFADDLDASGQGMPADLLKTATREVDQVATYIESTPVEEMLTDIGRRARQSPFTFLGAAFALGFLGSRVLKAEPPTTAVSSPSPVLNAGTKNGGLPA